MKKRHTKNVSKIAADQAMDDWFDTVDLEKPIKKGMLLSPAEARVRMKSQNSCKNKKNISGKEFDRIFDKGENVREFLDDRKAIWRVNVDFPEWIVKTLDEEAEKIGINRQDLIKVWVVDRIRNETKNELLNLKQGKLPNN